MITERASTAVFAAVGVAVAAVGAGGLAFSGDMYLDDMTVYRPE